MDKKSIKEYINSLESDRKDPIIELINIIEESHNSYYLFAAKGFIEEKIMLAMVTQQEEIIYEMAEKYSDLANQALAYGISDKYIDYKFISLFIKDYIDGMEKVIKKNIETFSSAMLSYAKKRSTDYSWDEQVVNNIKVKTAHFFKLPLKIAQPEYDHSLYPEQEELMAFAKSKGWSTKIWDAAIELEAYTRTVAKKELGK